MDTHHILSFASTSADKNLPYTLLKKNISKIVQSESTYQLQPLLDMCVLTGQNWKGYV